MLFARIEDEFDRKFEEAINGPSADLPSFVTAVGTNIVPLIPWMIEAFFSEKPLIDIIEAWRDIDKKVTSFSTHSVLLDHNGAAALAVDAVFEELGGIPKS
ncbi:hypothetical protein [Yoonia maricola]|uniref:hypothetical protein n=1 Tax=Yoonia maricola TaxID=420999 RepID=UPI000C24F746|nr:hypothetical protein [Yoonia maricola]